MIEAMHALFRRLGRFAGLACAGWLLVACTAVSQPLPDSDGRPAAHTVYVFSNGWHTGIVFSRDALPAGMIPEAGDFPGAAYLEFGWGDREYYPAPNPTLGMALAAALTPTPAVMHIAGLPRPPQEHYREVDVLTLGLSPAALARLIAEIDSSFERPQGGRSETVARGLYADSWFYAARGRFHLFNTCNSWTARVLSAAGLGLSPSGVQTASELMRRLGKLPNVGEPG